MKFTRRRLIGNALGFAAVSSFPFYAYLKQHVNAAQVNVLYPGMKIGHMIRDEHLFEKPSHQLDCELMVIGSGGAALTAAWKLKREGMNDFILLEGPEADGNNAGDVDGELSFPTAAHYLALPSLESTHIREMLHDIYVLQEGPDDLKPTYDEMAIVHAPEERLLKDKRWQEGMLPQLDEDSRRFMQLIFELSGTHGGDGKPLFAIPKALSSESPEWRGLDQITFGQWLSKNNYTSPSLLWYLNYCCRDDYGQGIEYVSAWAGLHYFACRTGHAAHVHDGSVLTWPDGLATLNRKLRQYIGFQPFSLQNPEHNLTHAAMPRLAQGTLLYAREEADHVRLIIAVGDIENRQTVAVRAKRIISAMPLYMASRVVDDLEMYGFKRFEHMPEYAPWMITNFIFNQFPDEHDGTPLAWDNVVQDGPGLGYVVSTHQLIRTAKPPRTAFTAYYALDEGKPHEVRNWMMHASAQELLDKAAADLLLAYPGKVWQHLEKINITLRGHGMCSPTPGYLDNQGLKALQQNNSRVLFAHSDLSGYSVFEEAAWWGYQAALKVLQSS